MAGSANARVHLATMAALHDLQRPSAASTGRLPGLRSLVEPRLRLRRWPALSQRRRSQPAPPRCCRTGVPVHPRLSHGRHLRSFTTAWNVLAGYPLLVPALAVGVHAAHHKARTARRRTHATVRAIADAHRASSFSISHFLVDGAALHRRRPALTSRAAAAAQVGGDIAGDELHVSPRRGPSAEHRRSCGAARPAGAVDTGGVLSGARWFRPARWRCGLSWRQGHAAGGIAPWPRTRAYEGNGRC